MNILDIAIAKKLAGGGGGSGTDNYNDLSNLPKINDTTLSGNKSSSALGLQSEINSDSKLASDLVDDTNQDNKFVTSTEKNTWNGKQNAIDADHKLSSDLVDDANKTNKFVTSTEKQTWNNKQNAIDSDHKLSSSLVSFTTAEAAALASGIDSSKVGQISTNQTNILYGINMGVKNRCIIPDGIYSGNNGNLVVSANSGVLTLNATASDALGTVYPFRLEAGTYVLANAIATNVSFRLVWDGTEKGPGTDPWEFTLTQDTIITINIYSTGVLENVVLNPMIVSKQIWDTIGHDFMPPALPNYELTKRESEDRSNMLLLERMNGAKNYIDSKIKSQTITTGGANITVTVNPDKSFEIIGTTGSSDVFITICHETDFVLPAGDYVFSGLLSGAGSGLYLYMSQGSSYVHVTNGSYPTAEFSINSNQAYTVAIHLEPNKSFSTPQKIYPMISDKSAWDSGLTQYMPYALPNYDLTRLESEDRAVLAEQVDCGAKNMLDFERWSSTIGVTHGTKSVSGNTITLTSDGFQCYTEPSAAGGFPIDMLPVKVGKTYVFSWKSDSPSTAKGAVNIFPNGSATGSVGADNTIGKLEYTVPSGVTYVTFRLVVSASSPAYTLSFSDLMFTTKAKYDSSPNYAPFALPNTDLTRMMTPFFTVPINHNMIYRGQNLGDTLTADQDTALSSGNFTDLYLGDYWTKTVTIPAGTYTGGDGEEVTVPAQTVTLKAVIADFDTFYAGYTSGYAAINSHHAAVVVHGFNNVVWNKTNTTAGGYVNSLIHKWLVGSALPQIETWFGSAKVLSHQKLLTNAITGDAASGWAWSSQKISLLSENQMYGSKVWGNSKAANGGYEPGEAFKHLNIFNHIDANLLFGNKNIWLRDIASAVKAAFLDHSGVASNYDASHAWIAPAALILLS